MRYGAALADRKHRLYQAGPATGDKRDRLSYANQFLWRRNTAVAHIRQAFVYSWGPI